MLAYSNKKTPSITMSIRLPVPNHPYRCPKPQCLISKGYRHIADSWNDVVHFSSRLMCVTLHYIGSIKFWWLHINKK